MVRKFLVGRKDLSIDAINAFVEGKASPDEIQLVENLIRDNTSLERDLYTQKALRSLFGRIEKIEAPRSFAVTPEMVAAAEGHDSLLSRVAELFATQRRLALAPAVIGVIAAAGVALLTIGDVTGIVDQSSSIPDDSFSTTAILESAADGGVSSTGRAGARSNPANADSSADMIITEKGSSAAVATVAPAANSAPTAVLAPKLNSESVLVEAESEIEHPNAELADPSAGSDEPEPPSIMMKAPAIDLSSEADDLGSIAGSLDDGSPIQQTQLESTTSSDSSEADTDTGILSGDGMSSITPEAELPYAQNTMFEPVSSNNGISLPLWQLQASLAALAIGAIGAWAGLRRSRYE